MFFSQPSFHVMYLHSVCALKFNLSSLSKSIHGNARAFIVHLSFFYVCVAERACERAGEQAGVNARAHVRTCTGVGIHTRTCTRTNVWVWGLNFNPHTKKQLTADAWKNWKEGMQWILHLDYKCTFLICGHVYY
jgi:hypothetical protein